MSRSIFVVLSGIVCAIMTTYFACKYYRCSDAQEQLPVYLYKIISVEDWDTSQRGDRLKLPAFDDAFIHLAKEDQLDRIIAKFWGDKSRYVVLKVDPKLFIGRLAYEANPGGTSKFYHLYDGFIPLDAVIKVMIVEK